MMHKVTKGCEGKLFDRGIQACLYGHSRLTAFAPSSENYHSDAPSNDARIRLMKSDQN